MMLIKKRGGAGNPLFAPFIIVVLLLGLQPACSSNSAPSSSAPPSPAPAPPKKELAFSNLEATFPQTARELRGQKEVYDHGWWIIPSTPTIMDYAHQNSVETAGEALAAAKAELAKDTSRLTGGVSAGVSGGVQTARTAHRTGTRFNQMISEQSAALGEKQVQAGKKLIFESWDFAKGGVYHGRRTSEHWDNLRRTWPEQYGGLKQDLSNVWELNQRIADAVKPRIEADWDGAFSQAARAFNESYEASGESANTFSALGDIFVGYLRGFYEGLVKPSARSVVVVTQTTAQGATYLFTPIADATLITGRLVAATGLSVYHATRTGIEVVAPTVEAGFLGILGLAAMGSGYATEATGATLGVVNQVAMTGVGAVAGVAEGAARTVVESGKYAALVTYDVGKATTQIAWGGTKTAAALGYYALTALPYQLVHSAWTGAVFLVWDGSRLVLVKLKGAARSKDGKAPPVNVEDIPVGTLVDLDTLRARGVEVEEISDDPNVVMPVLKRVQEDFKQKEAP